MAGPSLTGLRRLGASLDRLLADGDQFCHASFYYECCNVRDDIFVLNNMDETPDVHAQRVRVLRCAQQKL